MDPLILSQCRLFRYVLDYISPQTHHKNTLSSRHGCLIRITDSQGRSGWGEASPLPGLSVESLESVFEESRGFKAHVNANHIHMTLNPLKRISHILPERLSSSTRFGIESAIANLISLQPRDDYAGQINFANHPEVAINGLLTGSPDEILNQTQKLLSHGITSFKMKVGRDDPETEIKTVLEILGIIPQGTTIRLDANQSWDLETAVKLCNRLPLARIEYIEEPLADIELLPEFYTLTGMPYALDETLLTHNIVSLEKNEGHKAVILKPTILGGISQTLEVVEEAKRRNLAPVISSVLETGVGIHMLGHLTNHSVTPVHPAGLDTLKYFVNDLLKEPMRINDGKLQLLNRPLTDEDINFDFLEEIHD